MKKELDILIIEDVVHDAEFIEAELKESGLRFRTRRLSTRDEFLASLKSTRPDIILSDFTLPTFDALQALQLLDKLSLDIPFILVTGTRSEEVAVECIREGADDYILKASLKRLPTSIKNAIQKKAMERASVEAETALRRSEQQYRLIAENTRDLISMVDVDGCFLYASPSHRTSLGYLPEELAGTQLIDLVHPDDRDTLASAWEQSLQHRENRTAEIRIRHANGRYGIFESVGNWIFDEQQKPQRAVIISRDITRRKESEETLRRLPTLIREAQESERRRVARELHDSVIQILSSVKFRLQAIEEKVATSDEATWRDTLKAKAALEKAIGEVRRISRNLRPSELDDLGLAPALRSLCAEFGERTGMAVNLTIHRLPKVIPDDLELNLYRIVQEALGNIEKHSQATAVSLRVARQASKLCATISDNGCGFDPIAPRSRRSAPGGMGLVDMRERAALLGGLYHLKSTPGSGTEISVEMPLRNNETSKPKTHAEKG